MDYRVFDNVIPQVPTNATVWSVVTALAFLLAPLVRLYFQHRIDTDKNKQTADQKRQEYEDTDRKFWQDERTWMWKKLKREIEELKAENERLRTWTDDEESDEIIDPPRPSGKHKKSQEWVD